MEPTSLDQDALNLTKAIRQHESGGNFESKGKSGETGAYQFTAPTWKGYAKEILGDENAPMSRENQNKVAYTKVKKWKDEGKNVGQIASMWNAGEGKPNAYLENNVGVNQYGVHYDTPAYAKAVAQLYQEYKGQSGTQSQTEKPTENKDSGITGNESPLQAGINATKNTIPSALNFGKGIANSVNPISIGNNLSKIPGEFGALAEESGGIIPAIGKTLKEVPGELYKGLIPKAFRELISGDTQGASKSIQEDPFGTVAPVVLAGVGGIKGLAEREVATNEASMADYVKNIADNVEKPIPQPKSTFQDINKAVDTGISKTAGVITKPVGAIASKVGGGLGTLTTSLASHLTSLAPDTIRNILSDPKEFSKIAQEQTSRGGLAGEVKSAIDARIKDLSETGKGYEAVRNSNQKIQAPNFIADVLSEKGLKIKNGKIVADTNSITRNTADLHAVQKFYNDWGSKTVMTPNEFLNMRGDLAELGKYDKVTGMGKTRAAETIGKALYDKANSVIRNGQLEELKALDDTYAPEVKFLKDVKKDYFNRDGTFKDNAPSRIANAGNKAELLKRLEQVVPGITKRIEILKSVEDIQAAYGLKVGTYTRGILQGGALISGNIPAIVATILTHPANAVRLLRAAGYTASTVTPVVDVLKTIGGDVKIPTQAGFIPGLMKTKESAY